MITVAVQNEAHELAAHFFADDGSRSIEAIHLIETDEALISFELSASGDTFGVLTTIGGETVKHELQRFSTCSL